MLKLKLQKEILENTVRKKVTIHDVCKFHHCISYFVRIVRVISGRKFLKALFKWRKKNKSNLKYLFLFEDQSDFRVVAFEKEIFLNSNNLIRYND